MAMPVNLIIVLISLAIFSPLWWVLPRAGVPKWATVIAIAGLVVAALIAFQIAVMHR